MQSNISVFQTVVDPFVIRFLHSYIQRNASLLHHIEEECGYAAFTVGDNEREYLVAPVGEHHNWSHNIGFRYWVRSWDSILQETFECGTKTLIRARLLGVEVGSEIQELADELWRFSGAEDLEKALLLTLPPQVIERRAVVRSIMFMMMQNGNLYTPEGLRDFFASQGGSEDSETLL